MPQLEANEILTDVILWKTKLYYMYSYVILAYSMQLSQLEVTDIYYRSLPHDGQLKVKFKTFNMRVDSKPKLEPNRIIILFN